MTDATELDNDAIRARVEAATEGPWEAVRVPFRDTASYSIKRGDKVLALVGWEREEPVRAPADAEFIAHARTDLPAALDEVTRLRAALDETQAERDAARRQRDQAKAGGRQYATEVLARAEAAESALAAVHTLARSWSGRHDLLMTGDSAAHDIEAALAAPTTERTD